MQTTSRLTGGVSGIVQGMQRGDAPGILGGLLTTAGGVVSGLGPAEFDFSLGGIPSSVVVDQLQKTLTAAGALTSFGSQVAQGRVTEGLLNSLGPWLASLAAENYAKGNLYSSGIGRTLSGVGGSESYLGGSISQGGQININDWERNTQTSIQRADTYQIAGLGDLLSIFRRQDPDLAVNYAGERLLQIAHESQLKLGIADPIAAAPTVCGSMLHKVFADSVKEATLAGIGRDDVETSFDIDGGPASYGAPGSLRTDVILRDPQTQAIKAIFDLKPEASPLTASRIADIRERVVRDRNSSVPVYSIRYNRLNPAQFD